MPELNLPTPGVTKGPEWASQLNAAIESVNTAVDETSDVIATGRLSEAELTSLLAGGGGGGGPTYVWMYDYVNNVMPAPPATAPAGVKLVEVIAPSTPSFAPWMGIGAGKVFTRLYIAEG